MNEYACFTSKKVLTKTRSYLYNIECVFRKNIEKRQFILIKVTKFGGSSLASDEQFKKVAKIVLADKTRRYVVPSAPGKRHKDDIKITDMLYTCYEETVRSGEISPLFETIKERYNSIIAGLNLNLSLEKEFDTIKRSFLARVGKDYGGKPR